MNNGPEKAAAWLYQGLWRVLVRWFAMPRQPPELPARKGETIERFRPSMGFVRYLKFWFWLSLTAKDGVFLIAWIGSFFVDLFLGASLTPLFVAVAILPDVVAYVAIHLRYDSTWYVLSDRSIRIRRGIWTIHEATITFENVQDVKVHQGPLQRLFGIADVIVETAGGGAGKKHKEGAGDTNAHTGLIEGVADADHVRDVVMARVRQSRTAGLGDEELKQVTSVRSSRSIWTHEHLDALMQIRDELVKLRAAN